jgi:hypothetical protein
MKNLSKISRSADRDSKWGPPEFKPTALLRDELVSWVRCDLGLFYRKRKYSSKVVKI